MRNHSFKYLIITGLLLQASLVFSQESEKLSPHPISIRASVNIPKVVANKAFRKSFNGVMNLNASVCFKTFSSFNAGLNYSFSQFDIPPVKIAGLRTELRVNNYGMKLCYDKYFSPKYFATFGANAGINMAHFIRDTCAKTPTHPIERSYNVGYIEPEFTLTFYVEPNFAIGFNLSYMMYMKEFDPYAICLNQFAAYEPNDMKGNTGHINFGFGFYIGFGKNKE